MKKKYRYHKQTLSFGLTSSLVVLLGAMSSQAFAQEQEADDSDAMVEQVVVTGTRMNLQNAQDIKRESDTVVDAISAEDIGALPDRSVLEAIQRLPGVSVERFAGPDDPDHFSVEGSGAIIRGMTQTRSEFNGRDSFTANSGRGLNFQDVSPELMGGVDIYKNQTADMIEGGIGGTVSLRTRKPFDQDGRRISFNADVSYGDLAEEWSPTLSGLYSDRWDTGIGEFGLLISAAGSQLYGESHGIQSDAYVRYDASAIPGGERFITPENEEAYVWMPNSANALIKEDDRKRNGLSTALQWANPEGTVEVTGEYFRSDSTLAWHENAMKYQGSYPDEDNPIRATARVGQEIEFNDEGLFQSGELRYVPWISDGSNIGHIPTSGTSFGDTGAVEFGLKTQFDSRVVETNNLVEDFSLKVDWQVTESLELSADYQFIQAETEEDDLVIHTGGFTGQNYSLAGDTPTLVVSDPWYGYRDANPEQFAAGGDYTLGFSENTNNEYSQPGDGDYFQDYNNYFWRSAMEHFERSEGDMAAARLDGTYYFEDSFVTAIKMGVRYADREQLVRRTSWNWKSVGPEWSSSGAGWVLDERYQPQLDDLEYIDWSNFHRGGVVDVPGDKTLHASEDFVRAVMRNERELIASEGGNWDDIGTADNPDPGRYSNRYGVDSEYGMFWPSEMTYTREQNQAFYTRLDFAGDDQLRFSGNIGFRYVKLTRKADGSVVYPNLSPSVYPPASVTLPLTNESVMAELQRQVDEGIFEDIQTAKENNTWIDEPESYLANNERAFGNGAALPTRAEEDFELFLPSFNIKVEMTDDLIARFAASKAAAYPDISEVRNRINIGLLNYSLGESRFQNLPEVPVDPENPDGETQPDPREGMIESVYVQGWTGSGGNPGLKPMISNQYDVALEWYFSDVGQLSGTIFHKNLSNYFVRGANYQSITNPLSGETRAVDVDATVNAGKAKMDGFELSYQQFFEGIFDGFGVQATYTYIDASGVPNNAYSASELEALDDEQAELDPDDEAGWIGNPANDPGLRVSLDTVPLQGQSDETVNLVGMYEKYGWNVRLAYNWRSKYLLTTRDVISKVPLWNDAYGQLDGSVFYDVTDYLTLGFQATNMTNAQTETIMMLNDEGMTAGRSWFVADRRIAFVVRGNF